MYMRASELRKFSHFYISKTAISFNIMLVLQILCRYTEMTCLSAYMYRQIIFQMYRQNSEKALWGGGHPPPPPPLATLMAGNAKEADI